jgi:hypothetical protein
MRWSVKRQRAIHSPAFANQPASVIDPICPTVRRTLSPRSIARSVTIAIASIDTFSGLRSMSSAAPTTQRGFNVDGVPYSPLIANAVSVMKTMLKIALALALVGVLAGCVYDPGYVRYEGDRGAAYYGPSYDSAYYDDYSPGYYGNAPGYYGYGYGYPTIGLGFGYYGYRRGGYGYGHGHWGHGGGGGNWGHGRGNSDHGGGNHGGNSGRGGAPHNSNPGHSGHRR